MISMELNINTTQYQHACKIEIEIIYTNTAYQRLRHFDCSKGATTNLKKFVVGMLCHFILVDDFRWYRLCPCEPLFAVNQFSRGYHNFLLYAHGVMCSAKIRASLHIILIKSECLQEAGNVLSALWLSSEMWANITSSQKQTTKCRHQRNGLILWVHYYLRFNIVVMCDGYECWCIATRKICVVFCGNTLRFN